MKTFHDVHFHAMTMSEPDFGAFVAPLAQNPASFLSGSLTRDYIITAGSLSANKLANVVENTLQAFSRPIGETFAMMEDDLLGRYRGRASWGEYPELPYLGPDGLRFRGETYARVVFCPLVMDFTPAPGREDNLYYPSVGADKLAPYLEATIQGIDHFNEQRPGSPITFCPFAGINPQAHSQEYLEDFLSKWIDTEGVMPTKPRNRSLKPFRGIKLYPPLGTAPWPSDPAELRKMRTLYAFCASNKVPIVTHCDDQGFRGTEPKEAWACTDPASWRTVLENYPDLIIDFAHVGRQYGVTNVGGSIIEQIGARISKKASGQWFTSLMKLIQDFDNVYTDISFTGASPEFHTEFANYLASVHEDQRSKIISRVMFGSDFSVNLLKVESYSHYYRIVEKGPLDDTAIEMMVSSNPARFLGLKEASRIEEPKRKRFLGLPF